MTARPSHYTANDWPARADSVPVKRDDKYVSLGNSEKMLLWLMKNSAKGLDKSCEIFLYLRIKFPKPTAKLKTTNILRPRNYKSYVQREVRKVMELH
jgi:hypothetical protein